MAKTTGNGAESQQMFSADVVAAILAASGTTSISNKQYEMMSALDGTRTASSFQHSFRAVIAKAKDLKARVDSGETFAAVKPAGKRSESNGPNDSVRSNQLTAKNALVAPVTPRKRKAVADEDETPAKKTASSMLQSKKKGQEKGAVSLEAGCAETPVKEAAGGLLDMLDNSTYIKTEEDLESDEI